MSSVVSFGTNTNAKRKRVYYEGTNTVYEGMSLCYNHDTTSNILGVDRADGSTSTTTTEGSQNEGKFLRVEEPSNSNAIFFAGVVAYGPKVGSAGPGWLDVFVPNGAIVPVYTDKSVAIRDKLYLESGENTLINDVDDATLPCVGICMETIDRSSTAGLTLAKLTGVSTDDIKSVQQEETAGVGPSDALWLDCPWDDIEKDPSLGFVFKDDFMGPIDVTTGDGWVVTAVTSGAIAPVATEQGGAILFDSAGNASADDGVNAQLTNCLVKPAANVKVWFEARVKMNDATDQYYIGLAGVNTTLIASGAIDDTVDKAGFFHHAASTDNKISSITARTSADDATADVADNTDATYMTVGFRITGLSTIEFYVNGSLVETGSTAANIPNAVMCLSAVSQIEGTGADAEMTVDWVKVAQLGGRA